MTGNDPLVGKTLGGYRIVEKISQGGMAAVYHAIDRRLGRPVAIKLMVGGKQFSDIFLQRFKREIRALGVLMHPNIVPLLDFGSIHNVPYLVMPFLSGGTLQDSIGKQMSWQDAAAYLIPIARALDYAHTKGIIHRDVKPANILLTETGEPMLSDFGLMKMTETEDSNDLTGSGMVGTPDYMAPEQWVGEVVPQIDTYALGIVFYALVAGKLPYQASTSPEVMFKHLSEPHESLSVYVPDLPDQVNQVVEKALEKDYRKRYASIGEFADALEELVKLGQTLASTAQMNRISLRKGSTRYFWQRMKTYFQNISYRERVVIGGLTGLMLILVVALVLMLKYLPKPAGGNEAVAEAPAEMALESTSELVEIAQTAAEERDVEQTLPADDPQTADLSEPEGAEEFPIGTSREGEDGMTVFYVPAGEFLMGAAEDDTDAEADEFPQHPVYLDAFWIDQTEVTNGMYQKCVEDGVCTPPNSNDSQSRSFYFGNEYYQHYPVVNVNWYQATTYCKWAGKRLPTEAEWEKAASSGGKGKYPWGSRVDCQNANYFQNGSSCMGDTSVVDAYPEAASLYGALSMGGNVWEWVADWYSDQYYAESPEQNPQGPDQGNYAVTRGGAFNYDARYLRTTNRGVAIPVNSNYNGGFRCVLDAE
ncbi:MAG: SUMF1/EgtB/PvdO family nonheme iron enzyme [Anaerolineaceae bacterium]|nr:SUMF1/EgtB/PvdO family nonheme iron enzyme [Anaerolineaceae bacterium]